MCTTTKDALHGWEVVMFVLRAAKKATNTSRDGVGVHLFEDESWKMFYDLLFKARQVILPLPCPADHLLSAWGKINNDVEKIRKIPLIERYLSLRRARRTKEFSWPWARQSHNVMFIYNATCWSYCRSSNDNNDKLLSCIMIFSCISLSQRTRRHK